MWCPNFSDISWVAGEFNVYARMQCSIAFYLYSMGMGGLYEYFTLFHWVHTLLLKYSWEALHTPIECNNLRHTKDITKKKVVLGMCM